MAPKVKRKDPDTASEAMAAAKAKARAHASELVNFSFKYLETQKEHFCYKHQDLGYLVKMIERLSNYSGLKRIEIETNRSPAMRAHPIVWSDTSEASFGIPREEEIVDTPYQLSLSSNEYGRVHGFFISNTFYLVWMDKGHLLYPEKK